MADQVDIRIDAGKWIGKLQHTWNYIGYDECNYTHSPGGKALIRKFANMEKPYYMRAHHMLCTGIMHAFYKWGSTNVYTEDDDGNPIYYFDLIDKMIDIWLGSNCKPFFEIGFMPCDLADPREAQNKEFYQFNVGVNVSEYQRVGWAMPPKDYQKWYDLIYTLVSHCVDRYGAKEVETWYWELWNEPDIFYWRGTHEEFCKLFDYTEAAVHAALPTARFGGPAVTGWSVDPNGRSAAFMRGFLDHIKNGVNYYSGEKGTRIDFTSFHTKGGGYRFDKRARKQIPTVYRLVDNTRVHAAILKEYGYDHLECVLSEADPDGWAAGGRFDNFNLDFRNTEYYASYVASSYKNLYDLGEELNMDLRPLAWAFMFEGERCFEGTRTFSTQGIDKAVFNLFKLYAKLGEQRVELTSSRDIDPCAGDVLPENPEIDGWATITGDNALQAMIYCHHDDWDVKKDHDIDLTIDNLPFDGEAIVKHYRIDATHSNAYAEWVRQGRPDYPEDGQYDAIKARDGLELCEAPQRVLVKNGKIQRKFEMPTHAISLITVEKA